MVRSSFASLDQTGGEVMRLLFALLVFTFSVTATASAHAIKVACEAEISPLTTAAVRILKAALAKGDLELQEINEYANSAVWYDPFSRHERTTGNLYFRQRFARAAARMSVAEKAASQMLMKRLAQQEQENQNLVSESREKTKRVIAPRLIRPLHMPGDVRGPTNRDFKFGWMDGRPVFSDTFGNNSNSGMANYIWLDPMGSTPVQNFRKFRYRDSLGTPYPVNRDGKTWAVSFEHKYFWSANSQTEDKDPNFVSRYVTGSAVLGTNFYVFETARGTKVIGYAGFRNPHRGKGSLYEFDVWEGEKEPKELATANIRIFKKQHLAGKDYVLFSDMDNRITLYDVEKGEPARSVLAESLDGCIEGDNSSLELYAAEGGKLKLLMTPEKPSWVKSICTVDLDTGRVERRPLPSEIRGLEPVTIRGVNYGYYFDNGQLVLINVRTLEVRKIPFPYSTSTRFWLVEMLGRPHLVWAVDGDLNIFDLEAEQMITTIRYDFQINHIQTFTMNGDVYGLISYDGITYYFIRLTEITPSRAKP